ncbi:hypothetical protein ABIC35_001394 [Sphingomonas trueperi]
MRKRPEEPSPGHFHPENGLDQKVVLRPTLKMRPWM